MHTHMHLMYVVYYCIIVRKPTVHAAPEGCSGVLRGYIKILQRGVQWKQGVVICMTLYTSLLHNTTPIHCTPLRLHPPLMNTQYIMTPCNTACYRMDRCSRPVACKPQAACGKEHGFVEFEISSSTVSTVFLQPLV